MALNDAALHRFSTLYETLHTSIKTVVFGQDEAVEKSVKAVLTGGHILMQGTPGLGKSLVTHQLAKLLNLEHTRISFTPDLMPQDIIGSEYFEKDRSPRFRRGPIFSQIVLAEELNRATPKTQSALLEAMEERTVSFWGTTYALPTPFFVLATQNPHDTEGTYPLPIAQLDRFLFCIDVELPSETALADIYFKAGSSAQSVPLVGSADVEDFQAARSEVYVSQEIADTTARLVAATWPERNGAPASTKQFVRLGVSVRAGKAAISAAQTNALAGGRAQVVLEDLHWAFTACTPHRLTLNFEGEAEGIKSQVIINDVWNWTSLQRRR